MVSVANLAFPDTNTSSLGFTEQVFCFRFRTQGTPSAASSAATETVVSSRCVHAQACPWSMLRCYDLDSICAMMLAC